MSRIMTIEEVVQSKNVELLKNFPLYEQLDNFEKVYSGKFNQDYLNYFKNHIAIYQNQEELLETIKWKWNHLSNENRLKFLHYVKESPERDGLINKIYEYLGLSKEQINAINGAKEYNTHLMITLNLEFLKPEVINNLTEFQIAQIACFPGVQEKLIKLNSSKSNSNKKLSSNFIEINSELDLITKILAQYQNNTKEQGIGDEDWRSVLDAILLYVDDYNELIADIVKNGYCSNEELKKMVLIFQNANSLKITSLKQVKNYEKNLCKKYENDILSTNITIQQMQEAVLQKLFGIGTDYVASILRRYEDYKMVVKTPETKFFIDFVSQIINCQDRELLKKIGTKILPFGTISQLDKSLIERKIKVEYGKELKDNCFIPTEENRVKDEKEIEKLGLTGCKVYNAGSSFGMVVTVSGAFWGLYGENSSSGKDSWNRKDLQSQLLSLSGINSKKIGLAGGITKSNWFNEHSGGLKKDTIIYGFANLSPNGFVSMDIQDVASGNNTRLMEPFTPQRGLSFKSLINSTEFYNEINYYRYINGEKIQPSYLVAIKGASGEIVNAEAIRETSKQWGEELPVVIIDVMECIKENLFNINQMAKKFKETKDVELAYKLLIEYENYKHLRENILIGAFDSLKKQEIKLPLFTDGFENELKMIIEKQYPLFKENQETSLEDFYKELKKDQSSETKKTILSKITEKFGLQNE